MKRLLIYTFLIILPGITGILWGQSASYLKGSARLQSGDYQAALEFFLSEDVTDKENQELLRGIGQAYYGLNKIREAEAYFTRLSSLNKGEAAFWLSKCAARNGETKLALKYLEEHLLSDIKLTEQEILLDPAFSKLERTREWRSFWRLDWYSPVEHNLAEIRYLITRNNNSTASEQIDKLRTTYPQNGELLYLRSKANSAKGSYKAALEDIEQALDLDRTRTGWIEQRASVNKELKNYQSALIDLKTILDREPTRFDIYLERAELYELANNRNQAIRQLGFYLDYFEENIEARLRLSDLYSLSGEYTRALLQINDCLEEENGREELFLKRGELYLQMKTYDFAENDFSMALDLNPNNSRTYLNRGITRIQKNKIKDACYDLRKAFRMGERTALEFLQSHCDY